MGFFIVLQGPKGTKKTLVLAGRRLIAASALVNASLLAVDMAQISQRTDTIG